MHVSRYISTHFTPSTATVSPPFDDDDKDDNDIFHLMHSLVIP